MNRCASCDFFRLSADATLAPGASMPGTCFLGPPTVVGAPGVDPATGQVNIVNISQGRPSVWSDDGCARWLAAEADLMSPAPMPIE